jgi:hypothetical protein
LVYADDRGQAERARFAELVGDVIDAEVLDEPDEAPAVDRTCHRHRLADVEYEFVMSRRRQHLFVWDGAFVDYCRELDFQAFGSHQKGRPLS